MHLLDDNCLPFRQLRYLEELRNEAASSTGDLTLDIRDLAELRLLDPDQKEVVTSIAHDIRQAIAIIDAFLDLISEIVGFWK
jgi:hypothetical protein